MAVKDTAADHLLLEQTEQLVHYALDNNVAINKDEMRRIFSFDALIDDDVVSQNYIEIKSDFLEILSNLRKRTGVNPENLLAIHKKHNFRLFYLIPLGFIKLSDLESILFKFKCRLITTLLIALVFQYFWYIGLSYFNSYKEVKASLALESKNIPYIDSSKYASKLIVIRDSLQEINKNKNDIVISLCKWEKLFSYTDSKMG